MRFVPFKGESWIVIVVVAVDMWAGGALRLSTYPQPGLVQPGLISEIHLDGRAIAERLMGPTGIVKLEVVRQALAGVSRTVVLMQIDFFIFNSSPQALSENIVEGATTTIHADLGASRFEQVGVLRTGELATLIAIADGRRGQRQGALGGGQHKGHFQSLVEFPTDDVAGDQSNTATR